MRWRSLVQGLKRSKTLPDNWRDLFDKGQSLTQQTLWLEAHGYDKDWRLEVSSVALRGRAELLLYAERKVLEEETYEGEKIE